MKFSRILIASQLLLVLFSCKKDQQAEPSFTAAEPSPQINAHRSQPGDLTVDLGNLPDYVMVFTGGSDDANWQGATKGYVGDIFVDGIEADERTSGNVPYAGILSTNASSLGAWQNILNNNTGQSSGIFNRSGDYAALENDFRNSLNTLNAMPASAGYSSVNSTALDNMDTKNGVAQIIVINVTSGFSVNRKINITGDSTDMFIIRWDTDANPANGNQGKVKFSSGGAIVPQGDLIATNFINIAGNISSSGGGTTPDSPYPQGPRLDNGQGALITGGADFNGGGFFTGYWLTTGDPNTGSNESLSNAIFVGGWFNSATGFSMTSGTSAVRVAKPSGVK